MSQLSMGIVEWELPHWMSPTFLKDLENLCFSLPLFFNSASCIRDLDDTPQTSCIHHKLLPINPTGNKSLWCVYEYVYVPMCVYVCVCMCVCMCVLIYTLIMALSFCAKIFNKSTNTLNIS